MRAFMSRKDEFASNPGLSPVSNLKPHIFGADLAWLERQSVSEARAILAETEPAEGASFHVRDARGLEAGEALAEALNAFVYDPVRYATPEGSLYCFNVHDHRDCYAQHWARVAGVGGVPA